MGEQNYDLYFFIPLLINFITNIWYFRTLFGQTT